LYENGDLKKADDLLEIAIKDNNIDFGTLYLMGIVKFELGETYLGLYVATYSLVYGDKIEFGDKIFISFEV
jgi:hypothetical protein